MALFDFENQTNKSSVLGAGQVSMGEGTEAYVSLQTAAASDTYAVSLMPQHEPVHSWWVSGKTTDGFTVNANLPCSCTLDWIAIQ